jgi:hypothetical protein
MRPSSTTGRMMAYPALSTALVVCLLSVAIAFSVEVGPMAIAPEWSVGAVVGTEPSEV